MVLALDRVAEIAGLGMREADIASVPTRRVIELARYGIAAKAPKLGRHPYRRKIATLLATVWWLEVTAADDALELFDVFMSSELIGRASKAADKEKLRRQAGYARHAGVLRTAVEVLFEAAGWGENVSLEAVWEAIDNAVGSRARRRAAVEGVQEFIPPPDADPDGQWRAMVVERYATVRGFVKILCRVIDFEATADAQKVLTAMRDLPGLLDARPTGRVPKDYLDARRVSVDLVPGGWWQRLVFPRGRPEGTLDRNAYVFCVLELFHTGLRHRDIFATVSDRWSDPRARLLVGPRWDDAKGAALSALQLPEDPDALLAAHTADLDTAWRTTAGGIIPDGEVTVVVPVRTADARPNPKYFARKRGVTWLNSIRPGGGPGWQGDLRYAQGHPACGGPGLQPRRRAASRGPDHRSGFLLRRRVRHRHPARLRLPPGAGGPPRREAVADQRQRRLRHPGQDRPRPRRPRQDPPALAGHPARDRLRAHQGDLRP
jgi:hypothetical protein